MLHRHLSSRAAARPGKVLVLAALCLIPIFGAIAIAVEGGLMLDHRRHVQASADAAALAAAENLFLNWQTYKGADTGTGAAATAGKASAASNGYSNDGTNSTVTVSIPPTTGDHVGELGYAEVVIQYNQPRYFSRIFGTSTMPVKARAVARGCWSASKMGILVLDLSVSEALKANGGGTVTVANADLIVNSNNSSAVGSDGTGTVIKVVNAVAQLSGGLKSNTTIDGPVVYNQPPTPDPLAYLPPPPKPSSSISVKRMNANQAESRQFLTALLNNGILTSAQANSINQVYELWPGRYDQMPNFNNNDLVILRQASYNTRKGVYYLNGCGFTSTGAAIIMDPTGETSGGLMFYNDPQKTSDGINITGGTVILKPPTMPPYQGILFWQRRDADIPLQITGQGGMSIYGTFYVAGGPIKVAGSDATHQDVIGSQYISRTLQAGGNGKFIVDWEPDMVAPLRQLALVE